MSEFILGRVFSIVFFVVCRRERERERESESSLKSLVAEVSECSGAGRSRVSVSVITDSPLTPVSTNTKVKY